MNTQVLQRAQQAVGIAKHVLAADEVVASLQQCQKHRRDGRHAGGKTDAAQALLHLRYACLQRRRGGCALARIVEAAFYGTLEHANQVFHPLIAVLHRGVDRFMNAAVFHPELDVGMDVLGGEALWFTLLAHAISIKVEPSQ